jgi:hypothetical protein
MAPAFLSYTGALLHPMRWHGPVFKTLERLE